MEKKSKQIIGVLILVVLVLGSILCYTQIIKPKIESYKLQIREETIVWTVDSIEQVVNQQGFIQLKEKYPDGSFLICQKLKP